MRSPLLLTTVAAALVLAAFASPSSAERDSYNTDGVDDAWAEHALANPEADQGWCQTWRNDWKDGRVARVAVREFAYPHAKQPVAIDGGENGGMTVMGDSRDQVRILYRVIARARSGERAQELAESIQLELKDGWLRPDGPSESSRNEFWTVEVKAWVPRASDLALRVVNGPLGVRGVRGTMDLNSINGPMSLEDLGGAVEARVENGPLHVGLAGSRWDGLGLDAEAQNGPLNVVVPANYSARLTTGTIHGPSVFDDASAGRRQNGWITKSLGSGGRPVKVVTTNGPFNISWR